MNDPWIRVHANLCKKPVVGRAMAALGVKKHHAMGLLVEFWGAVSQHATNGIVGHLADPLLEEWAGWTGRRGRFATFIREHHLDTDGRINEWDEYAGELEERRRKDRDRKRKERETSDGSHADSPRDVTRTSTPTRRDETKRDETIAPAAAREAALPPDGAVIGEPALTELYLTIWSNGAIAERWGEQPSPLTRGAHATELAEHLNAAGMEWEVVRLSIYEQCRKSRNARPPASVNYFRRGILEAWEGEQARRALIASGERPPTERPSGPSANGSANGRPSVGERSYAAGRMALEDMDR